MKNGGTKLRTFSKRNGCKIRALPHKEKSSNLKFFWPTMYQIICLPLCLHSLLPHYQTLFFPLLVPPNPKAINPWSEQGTPTINKSNVVGIAENTCNQYSLSHRTSKIKFKFTSHILGTTLEIKFIHIRLVPHSYYSTPSRNSLDRTYIN